MAKIMLQQKQLCDEGSHARALHRSTVLTSDSNKPANHKSGTPFPTSPSIYSLVLVLISQMALAYPEGECFFNRKGLCTSIKDSYKATKPEDFYSHFMVEYIFNKEADHASTNCNYPDGFTHPRSGYKIVSGSGWNTYYGCWETMPFSYGPKNEITRRHQHELCVNGNRFVQFERGGSAEVSNEFSRSVVFSLLIVAH